MDVTRTAASPALAALTCGRRHHPSSSLQKGPLLQQRQRAPQRRRRSPQKAMAFAPGKQQPGTRAPPAEDVSHDDVKGAMTAPSAANKNWVRLLVSVAVVVGAARSTELWSAHWVKLAHLLAWGTFIGSNIWVTFFAGLTMFRNMPRQMFGKVQAKLFPQWFGLAVAALTLQLGTLLYGPGGALSRRQLWALGVALAVSLANWLLVEPTATRLMFERYGLENAKGGRDEPRIKALYKQFSAWHGISSSLNLVVLAAGLVHGNTLAAGLSLK